MLKKNSQNIKYSKLNTLIEQNNKINSSIMIEIVKPPPTYILKTTLCQKWTFSNFPKEKMQPYIQRIYFLPLFGLSISICVCLSPGSQAVGRVLGAVCVQGHGQAGQQDADVCQQLCGALHRHLIGCGHTLSETDTAASQHELAGPISFIFF